MPNKQQDAGGFFRWLGAFGGERATRESELTRPVYHAGMVALLLAGAFALLLWECVLIGRALPLAVGAGVLLWCAWPGLFSDRLGLGTRLALAVVIAVLVGVWWFWLGPALLWRAWFPLWWVVDLSAGTLTVHGQVRGLTLPLWWLVLRLLAIVAPPVIYAGAGGPLLLRFWQEIIFPGLSAVRAFPVDIWRLPFPPFSWLAPTEDATEAEPEAAVVIGPDYEPHTTTTPGDSTVRSNGSGQSWRRVIITLGLTDDDWVSIAKRTLGGFGFTDGERLPGMALHKWRALRQALGEARWLENPTGRGWALTEYGRSQFERLAGGDLGPIGK